MVVIFPPMGAFGIVGVAGVLLIWAIPELRRVPEHPLRKAFFVLVSVQLCVPAYFTVQIPSLPWISVRRIVTFILIILFAISVAGSRSARNRISDLLANSKALTICVFGFLVMIFLSIFTSADAPTSVSQFTDIVLNWYIPLFACLLVIRSGEDIRMLLKMIVVCSIIVAIAGATEFVLERRYYFDIFPKNILAKMMADNPSIAAIVNSNPYRNGLYRASSIFTVPLSFGEFAAMSAPITAFFILHAMSTRERVLGVVALVATIVSIYCSGARGGYISFLIAMPMLIFAWIIRYSKKKRLSFVWPIASLMTFISIALIIALILLWPRLHNVVLGGGDTVSSTDARLIQWELAKPHILENPITGHGVGMSGDVIGYYTAGGIPSVDSYILTLLVETGIPGFLFFFGIIACGIWVGLRVYLSDDNEYSAMGGPIACTMLGYAIYRTALSQRENNTLIFLLIGLIFVLRASVARGFCRKIEASVPVSHRWLSSGALVRKGSQS